MIIRSFDSDRVYISHDSNSRRACFSDERILMQFFTDRLVTFRGGVSLARKARFQKKNIQMVRMLLIIGDAPEEVSVIEDLSS